MLAILQKNVDEKNVCNTTKNVDEKMLATLLKNVDEKSW
jgi:hypothetical protein